MVIRVAGVGSTKYAKHPGSSCRDLFRDAAGEAMQAADVDPRSLDAVYVGNFMGELIEDQGHMGPLLGDLIGARGGGSVRIESACASGGLAVQLAVHAIEAGRADAILVGGVEQMSQADIGEVTDALANAADEVYENEQGLTFPGIYALMARRYMHEYDVTQEDLAAVSVKNHRNAVENPLAQFREEITVEEVLESRPIATPLRLYDACPISDGASAAILVSDRYADAHGIDASVRVLGIGQSSDAVALQDRAAITRIPAAERAANDAYADAGVEPADIDVAEVHDCFTIAELLAVEAIGFYDRGEGKRGARAGETDVDGGHPVNPSGGLLGKGHPVGATGVGQLVELAKQLDGTHPNQVPDAEVGLAHNVGGSGASTTVTILGAA